MNIKPLHDRVVIKPNPVEEKSPGGIIIPDSAKEKPMQGTVIAVGDGRITEEGKVTPCTVKKDDVVLYGKYSGTEFGLDGVDVLIMRESEIYCILGNNNPLGDSEAGDLKPGEENASNA